MPNDTTWSALADLEDAAAQQEMSVRFKAIAHLEPEKLDIELRPMILAEYALDNPSLAKFTSCRLHTLLELPKDEAMSISDGYNRVFDGLSSDVAMRRASTVQTAARAMGPDDIAKLHELIPAFTSQIPSVQVVAAHPAPDASSEKKKPGWMFWKKS